jgi:hypothetical protein
MLAEALSVTLQVIAVLEMLGVPYWIGGSLASALHGVARATVDTDLVAALSGEHWEGLTSAAWPVPGRRTAMSARSNSFPSGTSTCL